MSVLPEWAQVCHSCLFLLAVEEKSDALEKREHSSMWCLSAPDGLPQLFWRIQKPVSFVLRTSCRSRAHLYTGFSSFGKTFLHERGYKRATLLTPHNPKKSFIINIDIAWNSTTQTNSFRCHRCPKDPDLVVVVAFFNQIKNIGLQPKYFADLLLNYKLSSPHLPQQKSGPNFRSAKIIDAFKSRRNSFCLPFVQLLVFTTVTMHLYLAGWWCHHCNRRITWSDLWRAGESRRLSLRCSVLEDAPKDRQTDSERCESFPTEKPEIQNLNDSKNSTQINSVTRT